MLKLLKNLFSPSYKFESNDNLYDFMIRLQSRIEVLENENTELTNALYEMENRLESKIDKIHPVVYNIKGKESSETNGTKY
jgi:hypothetical protein